MTVVACIVASVVAVGVYLDPPGRTTVLFDTTDAASIPDRSEVRIAGVTVGEVVAKTLLPDRVQVEVSVDSSYEIGNESSVQVRMLTVIGGSYVALLPKGSAPLGETVIPSKRVRLPYIIGDLVNAAPDVLAPIDGHSLKMAIDSADSAMRGSPVTMGSAVGAVESLMKVLTSQKDQVSGALDVSAEYAHAIESDRPTLFAMLRKASIILQKVYDTRDRFAYSYCGLAELIASVGGVSRFYAEHRPQVIRLYDVFDSAASKLDVELEPIIGQLESLLKTLKAAVSDSGPGLLITDICIPVAGRKC
ncbi:MlaD family protein [Gordonia sp. MP11Mi]|uniref:MlaD family protein n=1 Tax=Gordonia sp. MP11Mi TaxID=3022769 RepID=UPI003B20D758